MLMMKTIAQEYAPKKIRINSIAPGAIATPINHDAWDTAEHLQNLLRLIPQKRVGQVEDIGKAAVWLASDDADYVNGNGGAIALGHPLGASGARLVMTAAYALRRQQQSRALVSLCVGVGQGVALALERV